MISEKRGGQGVAAQATVKLRVGDEMMHTAAEGDGPVNALDRALRKALVPHYPELEEVRLVDYKVRIVDEHLGTGGQAAGHPRDRPEPPSAGVPLVARRTSSRRAGWRSGTASSWRCSALLSGHCWPVHHEGTKNPKPLPTTRKVVADLPRQGQPAISAADFSTSSSSRFRSMPQR